IHCCAADTETVRYCPTEIPDGPVRSNTNCTGDPTTAMNVVSMTGRSNTTCTFTIGAAPSSRRRCGCNCAPAGQSFTAVPGGVATTTASAYSSVSSSSTTYPPSRDVMPRTGVLWWV